MPQILVAVSIWLHNLATVIFIGHFVLLSLVYLPALQDGGQSACGTIISAISKRSRSWLYASLLVFAGTGVLLMLVDPSYMGIGQFNNPWSILMLVKHFIIFGMIGLGFWYNAILRVGPQASSKAGAAQAIARFRRYVQWMAASGAAVLLFTALAQGQ